MSRVVFILAGGRSKRMVSSTPKFFLPLGGRPVLEYVLERAYEWAGSDVYCVFPPNIQYPGNFHRVTQPYSGGTGHAFSVAFQAALQKDSEILHKDILVLLADCPLIQKEDLIPFEAPLQGDIMLMAMRLPNPQGYGRILRESENKVKAIVEEKDATEDQRRIDLCYTGVMLIKASFAHDALPLMQPSPLTEELYLTDLVRLSSSTSFVEGSWKAFHGINTPLQWQEAEQSLQERFRSKAFNQGALLWDSSSIFLSYDTSVAPDVMIYPFNRLGAGVVLERNVIIDSYCLLSGCHIKEGSRIGPFAHLREGTSIGPYGTVGNFVETKNTHMGYKAKAKHLSYLGNAFIDERVNIGAGVITCNYDGHKKYVTTIGAGTFIGSHTALVAPITLGKNVTVGAGSTLRRSVPDETLAVTKKDQTHIPLSKKSKHLQRQSCVPEMEEKEKN